VKLGSGRFTGTGPMYGGARFNIGPMALLRDEDSGVLAVLAAKRIQANDKEMFRHVGVEPAAVPILGLKSTVHFRADFQPIAETILCVQSPGAHVTDPVDMPYQHLRHGVRLRPMGPTRT
jgi:microcystin degradation protein MlrC